MCDKADNKILIVDDESANILLLTKILETHNYTNITSTLDPVEVVSLHHKYCFDVILLDINMPEMNGYEVLEVLQNSESFNDVSVIASSGDISPQHIQKALDAGFSGYITKPMKIHGVLKIIDEALQVNQ